MNLIEGKIEWHGNGVVLMRERSVTQSIFQFCKQRERRLFSMIRNSVINSNNLCSKWLSRSTGLNKKMTSAGEREQISSLIEQVQTLTQKIDETREYQPLPTLPKGTLTEIRRYTGSDHGTLADGDGQDGLQQLLPALAGCCRDRWLVLVSPPQRPDAAKLTAAGIDPSRVLLVHARDADGLNSNGLKVVEKALQSGTCGAVVAWLEECDACALQRLRRAALTGHAWGVMFREAGNDSLMAPERNSRPLSPSLSTITPLNDNARVENAQVGNGQGADILNRNSQVVNIHSVHRQEVTDQTKNKIQLEMAIS
jgi:cell division inhibitor SulA